MKDAASTAPNARTTSLGSVRDATPTVGLDARSADELRWYLFADYEGDVGYRSNLGPTIEILRLGAVLEKPSYKPVNMDDAMLDAAEKLGKLEDRWAALTDEQRFSLRQVYQVTRRVLPEWGELGRLVILRPLAHAEYAKSGDKKSIVSWLAKLPVRTTLKPTYDRVRNDAESALRAACDAWHRTRSAHGRK